MYRALKAGRDRVSLVPWRFPLTPWLALGLPSDHLALELPLERMSLAMGFPLERISLALELSLPMNHWSLEDMAMGLSLGRVILTHKMPLPLEWYETRKLSLAVKWLSLGELGHLSLE